MSHVEQTTFLAAVACANADVVTGGRVIEIGAYDVNGTVRSSFATASEYVGVDLTEGPGVDLVRYGHEVDLPHGSFDVALSGECFEHDPHWRETFANMVRLTRPGGVVAFTCASRGRPEHGTQRTETSQSPGTQARGLDYYRNLEESDFVEAFNLADHFSQWRFWTTRYSFDLYFAGVRAGGAARVGSLPTTEVVEKIDDLMGWFDRALRFPLRVAARRTADPEAYQDAIHRYWHQAGRFSGKDRYRRGLAKVRRTVRRPGS